MTACNSKSHDKRSLEPRDISQSAKEGMKVPDNKKSDGTEVNNESAILNKLIKDKAGDVAKAKALPIYAKDSLSAICAICNNKIDQNARRKYDKSTNHKRIALKIGNTSLNEEITLYYQNNQMIQVSKRLIGENNKVLKLVVFNFDEKINCFSRYQWNLEDKYSFYDTIYNGTVIRYDMNNKYLALDNSQKLKIIQSAKSTLDSLMQHFTEFKYSIKWK